jgi:hypothetical protein
MPLRAPPPEDGVSAISPLGLNLVEIDCTKVKKSYEFYKKNYELGIVRFAGMRNEISPKSDE